MPYEGRRPAIIYYFMKLLLGRNPASHNRLTEDVSPATPLEPPNLPKGPHDRLS
ncbi:unnamed protein product, partial [Nesidiocoris tenuis]